MLTMFHIVDVAFVNVHHWEAMHLSSAGTSALLCACTMKCHLAVQTKHGFGLSLNLARKKVD